MRRALALSLIICLSVSALAEDPKVTIKKRYDAFNAALKKSDFTSMEKWLKAYCTPDFEYVSKNKTKYKLKGFIDGMRDQIKAVKAVEISTFKITSWKESATKLDATITTDFKGRVLLQGQSLTITDKTETIDSWVKVGSEWKIRKMVQTKADTQMYQKK